MTFHELEITLYEQTATETAALRALPQQAAYLELLARRERGEVLNASERIACAEYESAAGFLKYPVDTKGYISTDAMYERQKGAFHVMQHPRYCVEPLHKHRFFEILIVYAGSCTQICNGEMVTLHTGDICLIQKNVPHRILPLGAGDIVLHFRLKPEFFGMRGSQNLQDNHLVSYFFLENEHPNSPPLIVLPCAGREWLWPVIHIIICEYIEGDLLSFTMLVSALSMMLSELARVWADISGHCSESGKHRLTFEYIQEHIRSHHKRCSLDSVAAHFGYSPTYLSTLIKKNSGMTFSELRRRYRMNTAAELLLKTTHPISAIAEDVGYSNLTYFYQAFRKQYGITPQEYRSRAQNMAE